METTLAILMVLGIFVGIPAVIGFTIAWLYILRDRRARRAEHTKAPEELATEGITERGSKLGERN